MRGPKGEFQRKDAKIAEDARRIFHVFAALR